MIRLFFENCTSVLESIAHRRVIKLQLFQDALDLTHRLSIQQISSFKNTILVLLLVFISPVYAILNVAEAITAEAMLNGHPTTKPGPALTVSSNLTWNYSASNDSDITLHDVTVRARQKLPVFGDWEMLCVLGTLAPGKSASCETVDLVTEGPYIALIVVQGTTNTGEIVETSFKAFYQGELATVPLLSLDVSTNGLSTVKPGPELSAGESIEWRYRVLNEGQEVLKNVEIRGRIKVPTLGNWSVLCTIEIIQPGEAESCTSTDIAISGNYKALIVARTTIPYRQVDALQQAFYVGTQLMLPPESEIEVGLSALTTISDVDIETGNFERIRAIKFQVSEESYVSIAVFGFHGGHSSYDQIPVNWWIESDLPIPEILYSGGPDSWEVVSDVSGLYVYLLDAEETVVNFREVIPGDIYFDEDIPLPFSPVLPAGASVVYTQGNTKVYRVAFSELLEPGSYTFTFSDMPTNSGKTSNDSRGVLLKAHSTPLTAVELLD